MNLSGKQRQELKDALINAFPTTAALEQMLSFELDKNLSAIAGEGSLQNIVFKLIQTAESEGWVEGLITAARNFNSGNLLLQAIATKLLTNNLTKTPHNSNQEDAIDEYRKKVEEFLADDGKISFVESEILKGLQSRLRLTEEEARAVRDEVLKPFGIDKENLDNYSQVFTKLVDEQGYPLSQKDKDELKKLQEFLKLQNEDIALLEKEAKQKAEKIRQRQLNENTGKVPDEEFGDSISSSISCVNKLGQLTGRELHLFSPQTDVLLSPEKMVELYRAKVKNCWHKKSGNLDYREYIIDATNSTNNIKLRNFIVEAKFYNPYNGAEHIWKYGFSFRETTHDLGDPQRLVYTLFISSMDRILILEGPDCRVEEQISNLDVLENASNTLHLIVYEDIAIVFVNNIYIQTFDISGLLASGEVFLVSTGIGDKSAKYENFQVWKLLGSGELLTNPATPAPLPKPPTQPTLPQKILILAAIPYGLRLDQEISSIEKAIRRATNRDLFEIKVKTAVSRDDIRQAIAEEQPSIVHFCGHGEEDGSLLLEDDGGNNKPLAPSGLASLFKLHSDYVKCVVLNACHSEKPAAAISQYIDYAIGMNNPIRDDAAIEFAKGFYDGLGYKNSSGRDVFQRAFDEGMVVLEMANLSQGSKPVLKKRLSFSAN